MNQLSRRRAGGKRASSSSQLNAAALKGPQHGMVVTSSSRRGWPCTSRAQAVGGHWFLRSSPVPFLNQPVSPGTDFAVRYRCIHAPNCSRASDIKSPRDPFCLSMQGPRFASASHAPCRHFHGCFFFLVPFLSFTFLQCFDLWRTFTIVPFSSVSLLLFFFFYFFLPRPLLFCLSCFVLLFRVRHFYGDSSLPRADESLGIKKHEEQ